MYDAWQNRHISGHDLTTSTMKMFSHAMRGDTTVLDARTSPRYVCFATSGGTPSNLGATDTTGPVADS